MNNEHKISDTLQQYYDKVFQDGRLTMIHVGMWGMSYNLTEEDIKLDNKLPETIKLGKKMLIKPAVYNKFKTFEQKARKYLYSNSFDFPLVNQAHFIPKNKYIEVYTKLQEMKNDYSKMVDEFVLKYDDYKQEALDYYKEHAATVSIDDLENYYPPVAALKKKFYFDIVSFEISLPSEFAEINLQDEIDREQATTDAKQKATKAYTEEYARQLDTHMSKIGDFVGEVTNTLRSNVAEHCTLALNKIKKGEVVSEATIKKLLKHIEEFREMNFVDDQTIETELGKMEKLLTGKTDFKDKNAIGLLQQHLSSVIKEANDLSDVANVSGEYFRKLGV
jgi:Asp-tRNA(Asn)/Glu-tRNA(Gln) amidotransferase C subunit/uncharacterized protein YeeX (DUF496 family)